jgi:hypothetical protein
VVHHDSFAKERAMEDDELVVRAKTDRSAFGLLYDRYHPVLTRYCMRRLFDRATAEDVVSEEQSGGPGFGAIDWSFWRCPKGTPALTPKELRP